MWEVQYENVCIDECNHKKKNKSAVGHKHKAAYQKMSNSKMPPEQTKPDFDITVCYSATHPCEI